MYSLLVYTIINLCNLYFFFSLNFPSNKIDLKKIFEMKGKERERESIL